MNEKIKVEDTVEQKILDEGFEDILIFSNNDYADAFIGISEDGRSVYDYDLMVEWLVNHDNMEHDEAIEWIEYNTIKALPYFKDKAPIIIYKIYS